jgi:hypothetical protein
MSHLIAAELEPGDFRQLGSKPGSRPSRDAIAKVQRILSENSLHRGQKIHRHLARSSRWLNWTQSVDSPCSIQASHTLRGKDRATDSLADRCDRISSVEHQDDQTIPKDVGRVCREPKPIELLEFVVAELDPASHSSLLATGLLKS